MNEKGFTLVELMGILVILGLLLVLTVPSITNTLKKSQDNQVAEYEKTVCMAAKSYVEVNRYSYPHTIVFSTLRNKGFLSPNLKNPSRDTVDGGKSKVTIKIQDDEVVCTFVYYAT